MTSTVHTTAADRLRAEGQRYTTQRRGLVELLVEVEQPLTIPQLLERQPGLFRVVVMARIAILIQESTVRRHRGRSARRPLLRLRFQRRPEASGRQQTRQGGHNRHSAEVI